MTISVTITKPGVTDQYGRAMTVGTTYSVDDDFGRSLITQLKASDTANSLVNPGVGEADPLNIVYCNQDAITAPTAQMLRNYNTTFALDAPPYTQTYSVGDRLVSLATTIGPLSTANITAAATANTAAIQAALTAGGLVQITTPGTYYINKTLLQPSNTMLRLGQGVTLKLLASANCNLLRNKHAGVTITAAAFVRASNVVTVNEPGHPRAVGDVVLVRNLATDTTFNGLVTITAVTTSTWSYASTGSDGSPTGFGYVTPAYTTLTAASFVRASNVVTVAESGHTRQVGDSVYIANLATDASFNGTYQVTASTPGTSWTYASTGSNGSPTGTGVVAGDNNLALDGGTFDGNQANQASAASYTSVTACFGVIYGNVGHVSVQNLSFLQQKKYCFWLFNSSDVNFINTYYNTPSDCIHFEGPGDRLNVSQAFGNSGDDMVAFTNVNGATAGSYLGFASPSGLGNFGVCKVEGLFPSNSDAPALVKVTGDASTSMRYLALNEFNGSLSSSGLRALSIVDDTASLVGMTVNEVVVRNICITGGNASSAMILVNATGLIGKLRIENPLWTSASNHIYFLNNTSASNIGSLEIIGWKNDFNLASTQFGIFSLGPVGNILVDQADFQGNSTGGLLEIRSTVGTVKVANSRANGTAKAGYFVALGTGHSVGRLMMDNVSVHNNDSLYRQTTSGTLTDVLLSNCYCDTTANGCAPNSSQTIYANNVKANSGLGNNFFQVSSGTVRIVAKNFETVAGKVALFNFGGSVISYSCPDPSGGIDLGNPAASLAGQTPIAGDQIWNTNVNAAATGLTVRTAAGAWTRLF